MHPIDDHIVAHRHYHNGKLYDIYLHTLRLLGTSDCIPSRIDDRLSRLSTLGLGLSTTTCLSPTSHLQMALLSTKVKNIVMVCAALTAIVGSAVYIIGGQQKIGGLRHHRRDDDKVSRALRFMSPVPWPDMGKEKERKSLDRAQYAADHHEEERNLGKRGRKKKQRKKRKNKKPRPKAEKSQSLKGSSTTTIASISIIKDAAVAVAVVESSAEPTSSKSDKAMTNTKEELTPYTLPFQKDTVS